MRLIFRTPNLLQANLIFYVTMCYFLLFLVVFKLICAFTPEIYIYSETYTDSSPNNILKSYISKSNIRNDVHYFAHQQPADLTYIYSDRGVQLPNDDFYDEKSIYFYPSFSGCTGCTTNIVRGGLIQQPIKQNGFHKVLILAEKNSCRYNVTAGLAEKLSCNIISHNFPTTEAGFISLFTSLDTSEKVLIINYYNDKTVLLNSITAYSSSNFYAQSKVMLCVSNVDEHFLKANVAIMENIYVMSGFFFNNPATSSFFDNYGLNDILATYPDEIITDDEYSTILFLELIQQLNQATEYESLGEIYLIPYINDLELKYSYGKISLQYNLNLQRNVYIAQVISGNFSRFTLLLTNIPSEPFFDLTGFDYYTCRVGFVEEMSIVRIGYIEGESNPEFFNSLIQSLDTLIQNTHVFTTRMMIYKAIGNSIDLQFNNIIENDIEIVILYYGKKLLSRILKNIELKPYVFAIGYETGQYCNPHVFHVSLTPMSQITHYIIPKLKRNFVLVCSNGEYGRNACEYSCNGFSEECRGIVYVDERTDIDFYKQKLDKYVLEILDKNMSIITLMADINKNVFMKYCESKSFTSDNVYMIDFSHKDYLLASKEGIKWEGYSTVQFHLYQPTSWRTSFLYQYYHQMESLGYAVLSMIINFYKSIQSKTINEFEILPSSFSFSQGSDIRIRFNKQLYAIYTLKSAVTVDPATNDGMIWKISDVAITKSQRPFIATDKQIDICDYSSENAENGYIKTRDVYHIISLVNNIKHPYYDPLYSMFITAYTEEKHTDIEYETIPISLEKINLNNTIEIVKHYFKEHQIAFVMGYHNRSILAALNPVLEEYNGMFYSISQWDGNDCNPHVYHFGCLTTQLFATTLFDFFQKGYNYFAYVSNNVPDNDNIGAYFNHTIVNYCADAMKPLVYYTSQMSVDDILQDLIDKESCVTENLVIYLNLNDQYLVEFHNNTLFKQFSKIEKYIIVNVNSRFSYLIDNEGYGNYTYNVVTILPLRDLDNVKQNIMKLLPYFDDFTKYPVYDVVVMSNIFKTYSMMGVKQLGVELPDDYIIHQIMVLDSVIGDLKFSLSNQLQYPLYVYRMNDGDEKMQMLTDAAIPQNPLVMINETHMCIDQANTLLDRKDAVEYIGLIMSTNARYNKISYQMKRLVHFISEYLFQIGRSSVYYVPLLQDEDATSIEDIVQFYIDHNIKHVFTFISNENTEKLMKLVEENKKFILWSFGIPVYVEDCYSYVVSGFSIETLVNGILKSPIWSSREDCVLLYSKQSVRIADTIKTATVAYPIELYSYESNNTEEFYNKFMKDVLIKLPNGGSILDITIPVEHKLFIEIYNKYVCKEKRNKYKIYFSFTENFIGNKNALYDNTYGIVTNDHLKSTESSKMLANIYNYYYSVQTQVTFLESGLANSIVVFYDITNRHHTYDIDIVRKNLINSYDLPSGHCSVNKQFVISAAFNILYRDSYYNLSTVYTYERNSSEYQENTIFTSTCNYEDPDNPVIETKEFYNIAVFCSLSDVNVRVAIESGVYIAIDEINNEHGGISGMIIKPFYRLFHSDYESGDFLNDSWFKNCKMIIGLGEPVVIFFDDKLKQLNKVLFYIGTNIKDRTSNSYIYSFHWTMSSFLLTLVSYLINNNNGGSFGIIYNDSIYSHSLVDTITSELEYKHATISFKYKIVATNNTDYNPIAKRLCELISDDSIIIDALDNIEYTELLNSITDNCKSQMHFTIVSDGGVGIFKNDYRRRSEIFTHLIVTPFDLYYLSDETQKLLEMHNDLYNNKMEINPSFYYSYLAIKMLHYATDNNMDVVDFISHKKYKGMNLPLPSGEVIQLSDCPKFPNYLYIYEYVYGSDYILHYSSPSYYLNYPLSPRDQLICDCDKKYKTYKFGILASSLSRYSSLDSMAEGAIAGIIELFQGKLINGYTIGYELYSEENKDCYEAMNHFHKMGIQYIIGGDSNACINKAIPALKKNNQYLFVPYILGGTICNEHVVFSSVVPNQYLQFFLIYFEMNSTNPCMHIIYEAEYEYLKYVVNNLQFMCNNSGFNADIFPLYFNNTNELFSSIVRYSSDHCSLVYIPGVETYSMEMFLKTVYNSPTEPATKKVYIILAKEIDLLKFDRIYTDYLYLVTGYNYHDDTPANKDLKRSLYQYLAIDKSSNVMANAYTAVKLLYDGMTLSNSFDPLDIFTQLSYIDIETPSGKTNIAENNYIYKSFKLGFIYNNNIDYIVEHKFLLKPETWILAYPNSSICVVSHEDHSEKIIRSRQIMILLIYDSALDASLKIQFYYFIKFFNSEYNIINETYVLAPEYVIINSTNTCENFVKTYKKEKYQRYGGIFLALNSQCKDEIEESNVFSDLKDVLIFAVHCNEEFRCSKKMISHGLVWSRYIPYETQLLISVAHTEKVVFLASKENEFPYRLIRDTYTSDGLSNYLLYIVENKTDLDEVLIELYNKDEDFYLAINLNQNLMEYLTNNNNKWTRIRGLIKAYFSFLPIKDLYDFSPYYYVSLSDPGDVYLSYIDEAMKNIIDFDVIPDHSASLFRLLSAWIAIVNRFKTFKLSMLNNQLYLNYFYDGLGSFDIRHDNYIKSVAVFRLREIVDSEDTSTIIYRHNNDSPFTYLQDNGFNKTNPISNETQYFTVCNVTSSEKYELKVAVVAFLATMNTNTLSMLLTLLMLIEEANNNVKGYIFVPLVYDDCGIDSMHIKFLKGIIENPNVVVLFSGYDPQKLALDIPYLKNTDMLYIYPGYYSDNYCLKNLILAGVNQMSLVYNVYLELVDESRYIYLLGDSSELSVSLSDQFTSLFSSVGLHFESIDYDSDNYENKFLMMKDYCDTNGCVIVYCLASYNIQAYLELYNFGFRYGNGIDMYTFFLTENDFVERRYIVKNVIVMATYFSGLVNTNFDFITRTDKDYPTLLTSRTAGFFTSNYRTEGLYIGFKIWLNAVMKASSFEPNTVRSLLNNREYESPSGTVYLGIDNTLTRRTFSAKITENRVFEVYHYSSLSNVQAVYNPQYKCNISQSNTTEILKTKTVGYIADFSLRYRYMSQMDVLLIQQLLYDYNQLNSLNGYALLLEVVNLNNDKQDTRISDRNAIKKLLENDDLVVIFGCNSQYSFNLVYPEIGKYNIMLYTSVSLPENDICDSHIFQLQQTLPQKLPVVYSYLNISYLDRLFIIGKVMKNKFINETIENMISSYSEKYNITTYQYRIADEDSDKMNDFIYNFVQEISKIGDSNYAIFCTFINEDLVNFVTQHRLFNLKGIRNQLIIAFYQEYFFTSFDLSYLSGSIVVRPYSSDNTVATTLSFESYILTRLNSKTSLSLANIYTHFNGFTTAVKLAMDGMEDDGIEYDWPPFEYIKTATQNLDFETPFGKLEGSTYNSFITPTSVSIILDDGTLSRVCPQLVSSLDPMIPDKHNCEKCNLITPNKLYTYQPGLRIALLVLVALIIAILLSYMLFIYRNRKVKTIKFTSPQFLQFINIMGIITIIISTCVRFETFSERDCTLLYGLLFQSVIMFTSGLVLKVWRVHAFLTNKQLKKVSVTDSQIFVRIFIIALVHAVVIIMWGLIDPFVGYEEPKYLAKTTYIQTYVSNRCTFNTFYVIFEFFVNTALLCVGVYFSWTTRSLTDDFNESRSLATSIGSEFTCEVLIIVVEILVYEEPDALLFLELGGISATLFVVCSVMILPKVWAIYVLHQTSKATSRSGRSGRKKTSPMNMPNNDNKVTPAPPPITSPELEATRNVIETEVTKFNDRSGYSKFTRPSASGIQKFQYVRYDANNIPMIAEDASLNNDD